ncbi:MAG: hypothetical protein ACKVVP_01035 [Chloroflexota bacterium]
MEHVIQLVREEKLQEALISLWLLSQQRNDQDNDQHFNAWQRVASRDPTQHQQMRERLSRQLDRFDLEINDVRGDPLALVTAIDERLGPETRRRSFRNSYEAELSADQQEHLFTLDGQDFWLLPVTLKRSQKGRSEGQLASWHHWCRYHRIVPRQLVGPAGTPGVRVHAYVTEGPTDQRLRRLAGVGTLHALVGHFTDAAQLILSNSPLFVATGLTDEEARWEGVSRYLDQVTAEASKTPVGLMMFPELSITPAQRERLRDILRPSHDFPGRPILTVPGSFHETRGNGTFNVAELLDTNGRTIFAHSKMSAYGRYGQGLSEDISLGNILHILVTPIGNFTVLICLDFMNLMLPIPPSVSLAVDWWLVPSMGDGHSISAQKRHAQNLHVVVNKAVTLVANQDNGNGETASNPGFIHCEDGVLDLAQVGPIVPITLH